MLLVLDWCDDVVLSPVQVFWDGHPAWQASELSDALGSVLSVADAGAKVELTELLGGQIGEVVDAEAIGVHAK